MSERDRLHALCDEWSRLSESEGAAIEASDWSAVKECQNRKKLLQTQISSEAQKVKATSADLVSGPLIQKLMAQELHNQALLNQKQQKLREKKEDIDRSSRNLVKVRSAYSRRPDSIWNSFS